MVARALNGHDLVNLQGSDLRELIVAEGVRQHRAMSGTFLVRLRLRG